MIDRDHRECAKQSGLTIFIGDPRVNISVSLGVDMLFSSLAD